MTRENTNVGCDNDMDGADVNILICARKREGTLN
jgi:hypothetical protein